MYYNKYDIGINIIYCDREINSYDHVTRDI